MNYDIIIIGAGPSGYVMAERAGHLGSCRDDRAELRIKGVQEIVFRHPTVGEVIRDVMFEF